MAAGFGFARAARTLGSERGLRAARLGSGLVMMVFVVMHLANLALALISLETAEAARSWFLFVWRNPPGTLLLYGAFLVHVALVLRSLFARRTLVMPLREAAQAVIGLAIPLLVAEHVVGTRVFSELTGVRDTYAFVVNAIWVLVPIDGAKQTIALLAVWIHGCLGLHFWLRYRAWYPTAGPFLLIAAVLVPVLALLGFADAGRTLAEDDVAPFPADFDPQLIDYGIAWKERIVSGVYLGFCALLAALAVLRALRKRRERGNLVDIRYGSGRLVRVARGSSVLEASRIAGIPHYAVCGGKGRCSTCRIRILDGLPAQPPAGPVEALTLGRIHAAPDVRLACQLRPVATLTVLPLLAADRQRTLPAGATVAVPGREQEIAVLFCDIRGFTAMADRRLPFDVVFLLNRYFALVGKAVDAAGGRLDKFIGDGAMALFGLSSSKAEACRQALTAAAAIVEELKLLSDELGKELPAPLRVAIGIHAGPAIVGAMGYANAMNVTAIGDTVNVASRLEAAAKEFDAAVVVSEAVARLSGIDMSDYELRKIEVRGAALPIDVRVVPQATPLDLRPARSDARSVA